MGGNSVFENPGCKSACAAAAATRADRRPRHAAGDTRMRSVDLALATAAHRDPSGMVPARAGQTATRGRERSAYPFAPEQS